MIRRLVFHSLLLSIIFFAGFFSQATEMVSLQNITPDELRNPEIQYSTALLDQPRGCLTETDSHIDCYFRIGRGRRIKLPRESGYIFLGDQTIAVRTSNNEYYLIEGILKVDTKGLAKVICAGLKDKAAQVTVVGRGEFYIDRSLKETHIINTSDQDIELFHGGKSLGVIGSGMQIHFSRPNWRTGKYELPLPIPFNIETQMVREAKFYEGKKKDFPEVVDKVVTLQKSAAKRAGKLYKDVVERKIASIEENDKKIRIQKLIQDREDARIRAMFRKKVLTVE